MVARQPAVERQWTPEQRAHQERFDRATIYGRAALAGPAVKVLYDAKAEATGTPVFALALADFFPALSVDEIDLAGYTGKAGEKITIRARDDFELVGVAVAIRKPYGTALEPGPTTAGSDSVWSYITTTALPASQNMMIEVTVTDRPGHKTTKTQAKS